MSPDIKEAVERGYPTVQQRRTWTAEQWSEFHANQATVERENLEPYADLMVAIRNCIEFGTHKDNLEALRQAFDGLPK